MHSLSTKPNHRFCTKCKTEKPFSEFERCVARGFKYGIHPSCKVCRRLFKKSQRSLFPDRYKKYSRNHYARHREKIIKETTAYAKAHPEMRRKVTLKHQYGISVEHYDALKASQNGLCAICFETPKGHPLFVDHCHATRKVRGLLCRKCNSMLGFCKDNTNILDSAIKYIKERG